MFKIALNEPKIGKKGFLLFKGVPLVSKHENRHFFEFSIYIFLRYKSIISHNNIPNKDRFSKFILVYFWSRYLVVVESY